jgi:2-polyprenyl-6-methoxyphenol hydroxylase-like FAD-dependent oxidoreductase
VGADGATSKVRRFLGLPVKKRLIALQYLIHVKEESHIALQKIS